MPIIIHMTYFVALLIHVHVRNIPVNVHIGALIGSSAYRSYLNTLNTVLMRHTYVLEVVRYIKDYDEADAKGGNLEHMGYMKAKFRTKKDAALYYDRHNPHMRNLNAHGTWRSDWDPNTCLMYIVREDHALLDSIQPFDSADEPLSSDNGREEIYTFLK